MFGMIFPLLQISYRSTKFFPLFELAILNDIRSRHISRTCWKLWLINYTLQCIAHKNKSDIYTWTGRQHCNYDKSGCYIKWKYTFFKSTKYNCIMLMQMKKKNNQWCFKVDQCHWSLIMNMTNDLSVFVIPWQVNCGLHKKKKKKIYRFSTQHAEKQHKNNMSIIGTLGQITKASFRDSGLNQFILVQVTWDEQSSAAWLHITSTISLYKPVTTSYDIRQWPILSFSHYESQIAGFFF